MVLPSCQHTNIGVLSYRRPCVAETMGQYIAYNGQSFSTSCFLACPQNTLDCALITLFIAAIKKKPDKSKIRCLS